MEAVIVATARTPIGRAAKGSLVDCRPDDLGALVVKALLAKLPGLDPAEIEDVIWGTANPAGESGFNIARVTGLLAGIDAPGVTVHRACSSSLQSIRMAAHAIRFGDGDVFIAGGVETVSRYGRGHANLPENRNPLFREAMERTEERSGAGAPTWQPPAGLPDYYIAMGQTAENVAQYCDVSREEMDEFALMSQRRAVESWASGYFESEIVPVTLDDGTVVTRDDGPRPETTLEGLASLKPAFRPDGRVTAGNSCPLNDGAAAVIVMSEERAGALGIEPLGRVVASAVTPVNPEIMGLGPIEACRRALGRAKLTIDDIDLVEINEAFAAQVIPSAKALHIPYEKLNVHGGAIALGHPFGQTGARLMTTLLHGLEVSGGRYGLESMCIGSGQGMAMVVERL
jgi:acetyl-CoA C-acetyltransferase